MKRLLEIQDSDIGLVTKKGVKYYPRIAARAILTKGNKIALLHVTKHAYYKLPGGGVEEGETVEQGLARELMEETGCTFKILNEIGEILEYRSQIKEVQTSYCYLAKVEKEGKPEFTQGEIGEGFELVWVTLDKAINLMQKSKPVKYNGKFIVVRDLRFLKEAQRILG